MIEKIKVLAVCAPLSGHINLMCCIINELTSNRNMHVVLYSTEKFKDLVTGAGAEFRKSVFQTDLSLNESSNMFDQANQMYKCSKYVMQELIIYCEEEKPDLILCDATTTSGRYLINYLKVNSEKGNLNFRMPKNVIITPSLAFYNKIYPATFKEINMMLNKANKFDLFKFIVKFSIRLRRLNKKFGLNLPNNWFDLQKVLHKSDYLNICGVFPELQPKYDQLKDKFKFVGCCISEDVRGLKITNERLQFILDTFEVINPIDQSILNDDDLNKPTKKLIYISLGTIFNNMSDVFEKIIEAFRTIGQEKNELIKSSELEVVIATGQSCYDIFQEKIKNQSCNLPDNILILPFAPQIEILKRASLFITHAGMNSISEAIYYGVPCCCIPIMYDQPLIASHICDELKFGKKFDHVKFTTKELRNAIIELLFDKSYLKNILKYTQISRENNGVLNAADLIVDFLKDFS